MILYKKKKGGNKRKGVSKIAEFAREVFWLKNICWLLSISVSILFRFCPICSRPKTWENKDGLTHTHTHTRLEPEFWEFFGIGRHFNEGNKTEFKLSSATRNRWICKTLKYLWTKDKVEAFHTDKHNLSSESTSGIYNIILWASIVSRVCKHIHRSYQSVLQWCFWIITDNTLLTCFVQQHNIRRWTLLLWVLKHKCDHEN